MKFARYLFPAVVLVTGLLMTPASHAKPEYTKKEKKACTVCHTKMGAKDLNQTGKCYGEKKSLEGCEVKK